MQTETIHPKVTALLALEAMMIENQPDVYRIENYIYQTFNQIEKILSAEQPERLLNRDELKTFQDLVLGYNGGERRQGDRRREQLPLQRTGGETIAAGRHNWFVTESNHSWRLKSRQTRCSIAKG
ncbi:MAG: hypothetical protein MPW14_15175 [Candidatus Manganitrophus sp.]|nr:MAG: hypothetical protein MPW14_15175 [Candidatus Manganitrophus sp.]